MNESRVTKTIALKRSVWDILETGAIVTDSTPGLFVEILLSKFLDGGSVEEIRDTQTSVAVVEDINKMFGENEG